MGKANANKLPKYLRKRGKGYFLDYYVVEDGKKVRKHETLGPISRALAERACAKKHAELVEGRYFKRKVSFFEAADSFMEYSRSRKRSWESDQAKVGEFKKFFGDLPLETLNADRVESFLNELRAKGPQGKPLKEATLNLYIATLKSIVNRAVNNNLLDRNPIRGVKLFKVDNARDRTLTDQEYQRLLEGCNLQLRAMVVLAYDTAMRRGEILGLRWDQVDFEKGRINLKAEDTKTGVGRKVPLDAPLQELIRSLPRTFGSPYVFTFKGKPVGDIKTAFNAACRRARIENFRFHDLRHCAVTNMRKAGVASHVIMSVSGHKTLYMLHRYDRVDGEDRLDALSKVRALKGGSDEPEQKTA